MPSKSAAYLLCSLFLCTVFASKSPIPCNLEWSPMTTAGVLSSSVPAHTNELFVAKIIRNGTHIVGNLDNTTMSTYFELENNEGATGVELLNNPHNCTAAFISSNGWESASQEFLVKTLGNKLTFIGRAYISNSGLGSKWMAGALDPATRKFTVGGLPNLPPQEIENFEILHSSSPGLILEITNFIFDTDESGGDPEVSGIEIIQNLSPATIEQTITHTKNVTEIYRTTITKKYVATRTTTKKTKILFWSRTTTTTETYNDETKETTEKREMTVISVSKKITVPPFESIEACSEIIIKEEDEVEYTAIGRYTAPGLDPIQVSKILAEDGVENTRVVGNEVHISVQGSFSYKLALTTNFRVNTEGAVGGCIGEAKSKGLRIRF